MKLFINQFLLLQIHLLTSDSYMHVNKIYKLILQYYIKNNYFQLIFNIIFIYLLIYFMEIHIHLILHYLFINILENLSLMVIKIIMLFLLNLRLYTFFQLDVYTLLHHQVGQIKLSNPH